MTPKPIVLIGLPGSGKSALAQKLGLSMGLNSLDLDSLIEEAEGRTIEEIFRASGEREFRQLEAAAVSKALQTAAPVVIASGGGVVTTRANLELLRDRCITVWLNPPLVEIERRIAADASARPLISGKRSLRELHQQRLGLYSVAADLVVSSLADPATLAEELSATLLGYEYVTRCESVRLSAERSYQVLIGRGVSGRLPELLPEGLKKVAVVTQKDIGIEVDPGVEHRVFFVENGEHAKRLEVVGQLASDFASWGLTRGDAVVSVGGGVVSDLAGFVAASYHRGVPVVHVSTTLLGQIDAAIGGKTGVNLPQGKNLVGAFWQPSGVVCDSNHLMSLPPREFRAGMGELAKYHFLGGGKLDALSITDRVAACVRIKADVVAADEREGGLRAILNYGHTLAHALETSGKYGLRHGEAVAIGLIYAAELAFRLGRIDSDVVAEHRRIVEAYALGATLPAAADADELLTLFGRDKKAVDGITFVLDGPNGVEPVIVEDKKLLRETLEAIR